MNSAGKPTDAGTYVTGVTYASHGAITGMTFGNGVSETRSYDARLNLAGLSVSKATPLLALGTTYAANGNVASYTSSAPLTWTQTFGYDKVNRLASVSEAGTGSWLQTYGYDQYGNRAVTVSSFPLHLATPTSTAQFGASNRIVKKSDNTAMPSNAYDTAGNLTNHPWIGQFTYDAEGRVLTAIVSGTTFSYGYDGEGRRVTSNAGGTRVFLYSASGELMAEYGAAPATDIRYVTTDALGSTRLVTDAGGNVISRHDYEPFGTELDVHSNANRTSANGYIGRDAVVRHAFTGKERDMETGLDFFEARYLSSAQGRFTSPDPVSGSPGDPQSWNAYAYARNNPLLYTDPDGQTYRICDTNGNCEDSYSDANFDKNLSRTSKNGSIYDKDGGKIGTYQRTSFDDLGPLGNSLYLGMAARQEASNQFIGTFAVGSVAVGTGGALAVNAAGLTAGAGLTTVNLQGAAQAAALSLPAGAKLGQMIARSGNSSFIGNPQGFLSFARGFVETAVKQGTYAAGDYISKAGSTIYRVGNDFLTVSRDGRILSYVQGANAGGVAAKYSQLGGK